MAGPIVSSPVVTPLSPLPAVEVTTAGSLATTSHPTHYQHVTQWCGYKYLHIYTHIYYIYTHIYYIYTRSLSTCHCRAVAAAGGECTAIKLGGGPRY